ncbi:MAG: amidase [Betaproteobacteria bacterium]|nr:amidase [Betaproteobacteria bacterium]
MVPLNQRTATDLGRLIAAKQASAVEIAQACLARIEARDKDVQAWEHVDREGVLAQARACDRTAPRGPLHGIPFGVKDVIDTHDMPTQYGSSIYAGHRPRADAAAVALLREAGAVLLGKTVTVELAGFHWSRTRNPHDLEHTPGGSSSGSGAAVADFMTPLALGTQTGGSTLRPAAFCGVLGYKPSFNLVNRAGMKPLAESQDTIGLFARSLSDLAHMLSALTACAVPPLTTSAAPRIAAARMPAWPALDPAMERAFDEACARLARAGAPVAELRLPQPFVDAFVAQRQVNDYEAWRGFAHERMHHWAQLSSSLQARLTHAARCTYEQYARAQDVIFQCKALLRELFAQYDVLLTPSVPGEAPRSHENTGDSSFHRIWTALHAPALNLPAFHGPNGLPMGLQLIGAYRRDAALLAHAAWIERALSD